MNHHQVKQKITAVESAFCLSETDTAPTSQMEVILKKRLANTFIIFLLSKKPVSSFVLFSNSEGMVRYTEQTLPSALENTILHSTLYYPMSCCLTHICTRVKFHFKVILLNTHGKKPLRRMSCNTKYFSNLQRMEGKWKFFCIIVLISVKIPTGKYKSICCLWFSAWSLLEQSF